MFSVNQRAAWAGKGSVPVIPLMLSRPGGAGLDRLPSSPGVFVISQANVRISLPVYLAVSQIAEFRLLPA